MAGFYVIQPKSTRIKASLWRRIRKKTKSCRKSFFVTYSLSPMFSHGNCDICRPIHFFGFSFSFVDTPDRCLIVVYQALLKVLPTANLPEELILPSLVVIQDLDSYAEALNLSSLAATCPVKILMFLFFECFHLPLVLEKSPPRNHFSIFCL